MNNIEFVKKLKEIESLPTRYYSVAGGDWAKWNGSSWNFDCVILVKAILWGWNGNKNHAHGGANYGSNGVYDDGTEQIINRCKEISTNFNDIEVGELLWMNGHVGVYAGNRDVIECTAGWEGGVLRSKIGANGERARAGKQIYSWKKHGKLPYIEYIKEEKPVSDKSLEELAKEVMDGKWGNYPERKQRLEQAGYNYREVQDKVMEMFYSNKYLPKCNYNGVSIVDGLKSVNVDSSFGYRKKLASANGISNYRGSAEQNTQMLNLLKQGKLKQA